MWNDKEHLRQIEEAQYCSLAALLYLLRAVLNMCRVRWHLKTNHSGPALRHPEQAVLELNDNNVAISTQEHIKG